MNNNSIINKFLFTILALAGLMQQSHAMYLYEYEADELKLEQIKQQQAELNNKLFIAIKNNKFDDVKSAVLEGADVNAKYTLNYYDDYHDNIPLKGNSLTIALLTNASFEAIQFLIKNGVDVNCINSRNETPLDNAFVWSMKKKDLFHAAIKISKLLLAHDALIVPSDSMCYYLQLAIDQRYFELAELFLNNGFPVDYLMNYAHEKVKKQTMLWRAVAEYDNFEMVKFLVDHGASLDTKNSIGKNLLNRVITKNSNLTIIKYLVDHGLTISKENIQGKYCNITKRYSQKNHLCRAIRKGCRIDIIEYLIDCGLSVNQEADGGTPLYQAIYRNRFDVVKCLIDHGAPADGIGGRYHLLSSALSYSGIYTSRAQDRDFNIIKYLIDNGASVNKNDQDDWLGTPPLFQAINEEQLDAVKYLINHGALVDAPINWNRDKKSDFDDKSEKQTLLEYFILKSSSIHTNIFKCLLANNAFLTSRLIKNVCSYRKKLINDAKTIDDARKSSLRECAYKIIELNDDGYLLQRTLINIPNAQSLKNFAGYLLAAVEGEKLSLGMSVDEAQQWLIKTYATPNIEHELICRNVIPAAQERVYNILKLFASTKTHRMIMDMTMPMFEKIDINSEEIQECYTIAKKIKNKEFAKQYMTFWLAQAVLTQKSKTTKNKFFPKEIAYNISSFL